MPAVTREYSVVYGGVAVGSVAAAGGGNTAYTMEDTNGDGTVPSWIVAGTQVNVYGCTNAANDGTYTVVSVAGLVVTLDNAAGVVEAGSPGLAGFPVAGLSNYLMTEKHRRGADYKTRRYEFDFLISDTVEATFIARCQSAERAFRVPRQRFRFYVNSVAHDDLNPAAAVGGNTGFWQEPSIEKVGDDADTGRSRLYHVRIEVQLPADLPGKSGRQDSTISLSVNQAKARVITITGRYTALGANNARAQYNASIDTYAAAVQAYIAAGDGSAYELVKEVALSDDEDKNLDFTREYEEVLYNQSSGVRNDASIVQGRYKYTRQQVAPGDSDSTARRLEPYSVEFECWVDKNQTQDLNTLWRNTVRPYLIQQATSIFSGGAAALTDVKADVDPSTNRIFGFLTMQVVAEGGGNLVQMTKTVRVQFNSGKILVPVWDGNVLAKHVYDGPAEFIRTRTDTKLLLGASHAGGPSGPNPAAGASFGGGVVAGQGRIQFNFANGFTQQVFGPNSGAAQTALVQAALSDGEEGDVGAAGAGGVTGWVLISDTVSVTPVIIGLDGYQLELSEVTREIMEAWAEAPQGASTDVAT
jgi:hypothetical protein